MTDATASVRTAMARQLPPPAGPDEPPKGDPWNAVGYIVSGVRALRPGRLGARRWLGTSFLVAIGILVGAGLGIYMTYARFNKASR